MKVRVLSRFLVVGISCGAFMPSCASADADDAGVPADAGPFDGGTSADGGPCANDLPPQTWECTWPPESHTQLSSNCRGQCCAHSGCRVQSSRGGAAPEGYGFAWVRFEHENFWSVEGSFVEEIGTYFYSSWEAEFSFGFAGGYMSDWYGPYVSARLADGGIYYPLTEVFRRMMHP